MVALFWLSETNTAAHAFSYFIHFTLETILLQLRDLKTE